MTARSSLSRFGAVVLMTAPSAAQITYRIADLTEAAAPLGVAQCEGRAINDDGRIVGFELIPDDSFTARAIVWNHDGGVELPAALPGDNSSYAFGVGEDGTVCGTSELVTVTIVGHQLRITIDGKAAVWQAGAITNLNALVTGGDALNLRIALGRNGAGQYFGQATPVGGTEFRGFRFELDGEVTECVGLGVPAAMNHSGQLAGYGGSQSHALFWDAGVLTDLHRNPPLTGVTSRAWGLNDAGLIVGEAQFHISQPEQATLWDGANIVRLVPEFVRPQGIATSVNNRGQIIGFYINLDDLGDVWHGFLYEGGTRIDLLEHVDPLLGWEQLYPFDINEKGRIVGGGIRNGELGHGFVMTPIIPGDLDGDADVDLSDLGTLLSDYGCAGGACPGDADGDGDTDLSDLGIVLANYGTNV